MDEDWPETPHDDAMPDLVDSSDEDGDRSVPDLVDSSYDYDDALATTIYVD